MEITHTNEEYLKAIFNLANGKMQIGVKSVDIAIYMGVSKAGVTYATKILQNKELISKTNYGLVYLTTKGYDLILLNNRKITAIKKLYKLIDYFDEETIETTSRAIAHCLNNEILLHLECFLKKNNV